MPASASMNMMKGDGIPVVSFQQICDRDELSSTNSDVQNIANELYEAFSTVGFVYIVNHGISQEKVDTLWRVSNRFFTLPLETKRKYKRDPAENTGWVSIEQEILAKKRPGDYKETFDVTPHIAKVYSNASSNTHLWTHTFPDAEVPELRPVLLDFSSTCDKLAQKILYLMAVGLNLEDPNYFVSRHNTDTVNNGTNSRCLYYPPLPESTEIKPNQIRCSEHTDYGSITLLFQDGEGGLEILNRNKEWVAATPVPGSVIVNIGDLMQRWTADSLVSTTHRVLIPECDIRKKRARRSIAHFVHPDGNCLVESTDGSNKYKPVIAQDYLTMRFQQTGLGY